MMSTKELKYKMRKNIELKKDICFEHQIQRNRILSYITMLTSHTL